MTLTRLIPFLFFSLLFSCSDDDLSFDTSIEAADFLLVEINGEFEAAEIDIEPAYLDNGRQGLFEAIYQVIKYPSAARENGTQGTVLLNYEITESGSAENVVIIQDIGDGCGDETRRAFLLATEGVSFSPGMLDGSPIRVKKRVEIKFKLP